MSDLRAENLDLVRRPCLDEDEGALEQMLFAN